MRIFLIYLIPAISFTLLVGCASAPINVRPADPQAANDAYSFKTKPGLAKIYFIGGQMGFSLTPNALKPTIAGAILLIDGNVVGQIDKNDVLVVDVVPKQYNLSWQMPANDSQTQFMNRQLKDGDILILQANWFLPAFGGFSGPPRYDLVEIFDRSQVMSKRVISHTSCPNSICK